MKKKIKDKMLKKLARDHDDKQNEVRRILACKRPWRILGQFYAKNPEAAEQIGDEVLGEYAKQMYMEALKDKKILGLMYLGDKAAIEDIVTRVSYKLNSNILEYSLDFIFGYCTSAKDSWQDLTEEMASGCINAWNSWLKLFHIPFVIPNGNHHAEKFEGFTDKDNHLILDEVIAYYKKNKDDINKVYSDAPATIKLLKEARKK